MEHAFQPMEFIFHAMEQKTIGDKIKKIPEKMYLCTRNKNITNIQARLKAWIKKQ